MKLIDEKGRLFGWINLLDLVVLLGVLAAIYVGITAWVALRQPPLKAVSLKPAKVATGAASKVTLHLDNERYLLNARLSLIPEGFDGDTHVLTGTIPMNVRDSVVFTIPPDIAPGTYRADVEATTRDVFRRQSLVTTPVPEPHLTVEPAKAQKRTRGSGPAYDGGTSWSLNFKAVLLSGEEDPPELRVGDSLVTRSGLNLIVKSVVEEIGAVDLEAVADSLRKDAFAAIELTVETDFDSLGRFLENDGSQVELSHLGRTIRAELSKDMEVVLNMLFYLDDPTEVSLFADKPVLAGGVDQPGAEVLVAYGEADNAWVSRAAVPSGENLQQAFEVARVRLESRWRDGALYYGRAKLEPDRLLDFQAGETRLRGGILSAVQPRLKSVVRVMFEAVPARIVPLLKRGVAITDQQGRDGAGEILRVLDIESVPVPGDLAFRSQPGFGRDYRRVVMDLDLDCTISSGTPQFLGQQVKYGRNLNLAILGQRLSGVVYHNSQLPPAGKLVWKPVQVVFRNVPQELVAWIRAGEQEYNQAGPSTWKIERIMSNRASQVVYPNTSGQATISEYPLSRDIRCMMNVQVVVAGDDIYYQGNPLRIGTNLNFTARRWSYSASIVSF